MNSNIITGIIITLILFIGGFFFRKNKIYFFIQIIWIDFLFIGNTNSVDFLANSSIFYNAGSAGNTNIFLDGLYSLLASEAKKIGMQYLTFNGILATISLFLIAFVIFNMSSKPCIVISYFMLYPMISCIIQKRWFIAMGILTIALYILSLNLTKIRKIIIASLLITLAAGIHSSSIFFYSLIIFFILPDKFKKIFSISWLIFFSIFRNLISKFGLTNSDISGKSQLYFVNLASNNLGHYIFWLVWQLLFVLFILNLCKKNKIKKIWGESFTYFIWTINWWSLMIIPLYSFDPVFARFFRIVLIFNYIGVSNLIIIHNNQIEKIAIGSGLYQLFLCFFTFIIVEFFAGLPFDQLVLPIFEYNTFLNFI